MESDSEFLSVLRQIRDSHQELVALLKAWQQNYDRSDREWKEQSDRRFAEMRARAEQSEAANVVWREANEAWLRTQKLSQKVAVILLVIVAIGAAVFGILSVGGWL